MKIAIIYKSLLGATKAYAVWLSQEVEADIYSFYQAKPGILAGYDIIVVGSGTYAGQMPLVSFLKKNWWMLSKKKVVVMAVGTIPSKDRESRLSYELIPPEIRSNIAYFKLPGRMLTTGPEGQPDRSKLKPLVKTIKSFGKVKL